jgi:hypothetical protein
MRSALALLLALASFAVTAADLTGKVTGISDGDTLTLLVLDGNQDGVPCETLCR